jgi:hypothetical protein
MYMGGMFEILHHSIQRNFACTNAPECVNTETHQWSDSLGKNVGSPLAESHLLGGGIREHA